MKKLKELSPFNFLVLTLSGIINAIGITMFLSPVGLYDSGFSGTSMFLGKITPEYLTLSMFLIILNLPFFIYGCKKEGLVFTIYSIYALSVYSIASFVITDILPIDVSSASLFTGSDLFLCAVFGGLISGVGSGLTIRFGGAIDGVEVMAVIFAKRIGITVGNFVMIYNALLYIIVGIVMQSWILPLYSVVTYAVAVKTIDFIVEGLDRAKSAIIITNKANEIGERLSEVFGKGITVMGAKGYYSNEEKCAIYFVVNRFQIGTLKRIVKQTDPGAFVTISEVSDMFGSSTKSD